MGSTELTRERFEEILTSGRLEGLIGQRENEWFDFKNSLYDLRSVRQRAELCKDVTAFANLGGGYILLGAAGKIVIEGEVLDRIRPIPAERFNRNQFQEVLKTWIHPVVVGLSVDWIRINDENTKGVVLVHIPEQSERLKPFLYYAAIDDEQKGRDLFFGYSIRCGDSTISPQVDKVQGFLRDGLNSHGEISAKLDGLSDAIQKQREEKPNADEFWATVDRRKKPDGRPTSAKPSDVMVHMGLGKRRGDPK